MPTISALLTNFMFITLFHPKESSQGTSSSASASVSPPAVTSLLLLDDSQFTSSACPSCRHPTRLPVMHYLDHCTAPKLTSKMRGSAAEGRHLHCWALAVFVSTLRNSCFEVSTVPTQGGREEERRTTRRTRRTSRTRRGRRKRRRRRKRQRSRQDSRDEGHFFLVVCASCLSMVTFLLRSRSAQHIKLTSCWISASLRWPQLAAQVGDYLPMRRHTERPPRSTPSGTTSASCLVSQARQAELDHISQTWPMAISCNHVSLLFGERSWSSGRW